MRTVGPRILLLYRLLNIAYLLNAVYLAQTLRLSAQKLHTVRNVTSFLKFYESAQNGILLQKISEYSFSIFGRPLL